MQWRKQGGGDDQGRADGMSTETPSSRMTGIR